MKQQQQGFTLIELIVVIVILGILAATALPKFADFSRDARISAVNGISGALGSAASVVKAQYLITGSATATTVTIDGTAITVVPGSGVPVATAAGIEAALQGVQGMSRVYTTGPNVAKYFPVNGGNITNCYASYTESTAAVSAVTGGC